MPGSSWERESFTPAVFVTSMSLIPVLVDNLDLSKVVLCVCYLRKVEIIDSTGIRDIEVTKKLCRAATYTFKKD